MKFRVVTLIAGVAAATLAPFGVVTPVHAAQNYNEYSVTLPPFVTGPTPFEVIVDGPDPVCSMRFAGTTVTAAPWVFTYEPSAHRGSHRVEIDTCNGYSGVAYVDTELAFTISDRFLRSYDGKEASITVWNRMEVPGSVSVSDEKGRVVAAVALPADEMSEVRIPMKGLKATTVFTFTMTGANGITQTTRVTAPHGWSVLFEEMGATFAPCSTLTWSYDKAGAPGNAKTMQRDIEGSLDRLSKLTGLTFVYTDDTKGSDMLYDWQSMGKGGPGAIGGYRGADDIGRGLITFNADNYWPTDKYAGFKPFKRHSVGNRTWTVGPAGRGWLVIHETMHALGLDHVDDRKSIMAPINRGQAKFTRGDLEGLRALYPTAGCAA